MTESTKTNDSMVNFAARLGLGQDNLMSGTRYDINPLTRDRQTLDNMYRGSWIVRQAVGVVADDMTRAGVEFHNTKDESDVKVLHAALGRLDVWGQLTLAIKWGRLYGGCLAVMMIDGQDASTPLRPETVGRGAFRGLLVLDRWLVTPSMKVVSELGPNLGRPESYRVNIKDGSTLRLGDIHYSRVMRFEGEDLPYFQRMFEMGWGMSIVEPFHDRLVAFDSTTIGMAQMVYKAYLRTYKMANLRAAIAAGGKSLEGALSQIDMIRRFQSSEGMTVVDASDTIETASYSFGGLPEVLIQMSQQIAGATGIPVVKLFGMSPTGFSSGDADIRSYDGNIALKRERKLRHPLDALFKVLHYSELGRDVPREFGFDFGSLSMMSGMEKSQLAGSTTSAVVAAEGAQIIKRSTALRELKAQSQATGIFASIEDADIEEAVQEESVQALPEAPAPGGELGAGPDEDAGVEVSREPPDPEDPTDEKAEREQRRVSEPQPIDRLRIRPPNIVARPRPVEVPPPAMVAMPGRR